MMNRADCLKTLARHVTDEVVVATYSAAFDWLSTTGDRPLNHFSFGGMGLASSHALGLALAFPQRRVLVLDGDGSLLMNLGSLVTIAAVSPKNLVHFVCQNGCYEANGGHPLPNPEVDFAGIARSAGWHACCTFDDLATFESEIPSLLNAEGPVFAVLKIEQGPNMRRVYADMYKPARRAALKAALAGAAVPA